MGPLFGCAAAASMLGRLDAHQVRQALAYTAQQASGITSWGRDPEHIEKAFVFGGMGARNGVTSAVFVQLGFSGEDDVFSGDNNFLSVFCRADADLAPWAANLGEHYEISITNIKKYCVGSPIQAPADAMEQLVAEYGLTTDKVASVAVLLPPHSMRVVNDRAMPDVNCQYIVAAILLDGKLTFKAAHDYDRMSDPVMQATRAKITLTGDAMFAGGEQTRPGLVRATLTDGRTVEKLVSSVRGTAQNPMTQQEVEAKVLDLTEDTLGPARARELVDAVWHLEDLKSVRELRRLLSA